jgi:pimeloyl-ACP methyl ester carboxylesterase
MDAPSWPGQLVETSRGGVFVRHDADAAGSRRPALFVHGLGGESLDWAEVARAVSDLLDCYAADLPGFAHSPPPTDGDFTLDGQARSVVEVARLIGAPVHLVGNSLGGAVAVRVAAEHPELVQSLTLISPALPDVRPRIGSAQLTVALMPVIGPLIVRLAIRADPEWMARRIYALCYGDPKAVSPDRHARELATLRLRASLPHSPRAYRSSLRTMVAAYLDPGPRRLWKQLRQVAAVGVPTLVIYGGRDKLVAARVALRAKRTFPDAELLRLPVAGHVAHLEDPATVAAALRTLVSRPDLGGGMSGRRGTVMKLI